MRPTHPPVNPDGAFHAFWTQHVAPGSDTYGLVLGDQRPTVSGCATDNNQTQGWTLVDFANLFKPDLDASGDGVPNCDSQDGGCGSGSCGNNAPGAVSATTSSMDVRINLGPQKYARSAGYLYLHADAPSSALYLSSSLMAALEPSVTSSNNRDGTFTEIDTDTIRAVFQTNSVGYTIWFSNIVDYPPSLAASVTVSNNADTNKFLVAEVLGPGGFPRTIEFDFNAASTNWTKIEGAGLQNESRTTIWTTPTNRTDFIVLSNSVFGIAKRTTTQTRLFPWGETKVQETIGTGPSAKTTTFTYCDDPMNTSSFGQMTQKVDSVGHWERYQYDFAGRSTSKAVQFLDNPISTADTANRVTQTIYDDPDRLTTTIEKLANVEIARTYIVQFEPANGLQLVQTIRCQTPGATINDPANLTNTIWRTTDTPITGIPWQIQQEQNPDGTIALYNYAENSPQLGQTKTTLKSGAPDTCATDVTDGTESTTIIGPLGEILTNVVTDITSGLVIDTNCYVYSDNLRRSYTVIHMDGTTEAANYACCGLDTATDRDSATTQYSYDAARRQAAAAARGITTTNILNGANQILQTIRIGRDGSQIRLSSASYNDDGTVATKTNALGGVTFILYGTNSSGQTVITDIFPDGGTRVETYHQDGSLYSVGGTAAMPLLYAYGVDADGPYTTEIKVSSTGGTNEWVKTSRDMQDRAYKTAYSAASGPYPYALNTYNAVGQITNTVDPDGVINLFAYNPKGEQVLSIVDSNRNYAIDFSGADRITFTTNDVITDHSTTMRRARTYAWSTVGSATSNLVAMTEASADGLQSWRTIYANSSTPVTSYSRTIYGTSAYRYTTNVQPDGSFTLDVSRYGTNVSSTCFDSLGNSLSSISYLQDSHGRRAAMIDARSGATTNWFNNADLINGTKTPVPGPGQSAEVTSNFFDTSVRMIATKLPDGTYVTNLPNVNGETRLTFGWRVYASGNGFDAQGREQTLTNWSTFATAGQRVTTWNHNQYRGWLDSKRYPNSTGPNYTYTAAARLASRAWARGTNTAYSWNNAGELSGTAYNDGATAALGSSFDRRGREVTAAQGSISTTRDFNDAGKQLSESYSGGPLDGLSIANGLDQFLRRTNRVLQSAIGDLQSNYFGYDLASRFASIGDGTNSAAYAYLANSPLIGQVSYYNNGTLRMTRSNQCDNLNRLTNLTWKVGSTVIASFAYQYNNANQRTRLTLADGSYWLFGHDSLGQLISGKHYWPDGSPVAGQQFEYGFDDIGNRTITRSGGDQYNGSYLRSANYSANLLNQITSRDVPGYLNVFGSANSNATVSLWTADGYWVQTSRHGDWYRGELAVNNSTGALWLTITNLAVLPNGSNPDIVTNSVGRAFVPRAPQPFAYDPDGNLTNDGRFVIAWDTENRATSFTSLTSTPAASRIKVDCTYDSQWRRTQKIVSTWNPSTLTYQPSTTNRFVYDGWNLVAILDQANNPLYSFTWGTDLSGTEQGAGGIGGLISMRVHSGPLAGTYFYVFDGNGDVMMLVNAADGSIAAEYEYGPFGELLRGTGSLAPINPFRFSTKFQDDGTGFVYYGHRFYDSSAGKWLSRDPIEEQGGLNLYCMVGNNPVTRIDPQGLTDWGDVIPGWWDAGWNTFDWVLGHSGSTDYGPDSLQSRQMSQSSIAGQLRAYFLNKNKDKLCKDWKGVSNFKTHFRVFHEVIFDAFNGTAEFVGDARGDVIAKKDLVNCKIKAEFHFMNTTSLRSLLYEVWPDSWNVTLPGFPLANWTQFYVWNETFDCNCCHSTGVGGSW